HRAVGDGGGRLDGPAIVAEVAREQLHALGLELPFLRARRAVEGVHATVARAGVYLRRVDCGRRSDATAGLPVPLLLAAGGVDRVHAPVASAEEHRAIDERRGR